MLDVAFIGLTILFAIWNTVTLIRYASFRRLVSTAELTWSPTRPWFYNICLAIGFFMVSLTALSLFVLERPVMATVAQALMALYYTIVFPLSFRIQRGFYEKGIWFERAFVPYGSVRRLSWREKPDIVLVVMKETDLTGQSYARLQVPGESYGEARRILASHIEDQTLTVEKSILGLSDAETSAQEQV